MAARGEHFALPLDAEDGGWRPWGLEARKASFLLILRQDDLAVFPRVLCLMRVAFPGSWFLFWVCCGGRVTFGLKQCGVCVCVHVGVRVHARVQVCACAGWQIGVSM